MSSKRRVNQRGRMLALVLLICLITIAHYSTGIQYYPLHDIYRRLYYIPIVLAAFWYGLQGGLVISSLVAIIYMPHVLLQWGGSLLSTNLEKTLEIVLYLIIGLITGILSQRQKDERYRYQKLAEELENSYQQLKTQTQALLEAEEQLRRADRLSALGELSAGLAHEIRNPLGSVLGTAEIFADKFSPQDKEYKFAQILIKEVRRLDKVLTEFLNFASPKPPEIVECDLNNALESVLSLTSRQRQRQNIELRSHLGQDLPLVKADPEQLRQVFLNLILNATQAMPQGGTLVISTWSEAPRTYCAIKDSGCGIPPENMDKLFNPFFTTKARGTGLGLSIAYKILDRFGAEISVNSTPQQGAEFLITFPPQPATGRISA